MKSYSAKLSDIKKSWFLIDADKLVLGRLSSVIALLLRGKHKSMFTPHMDCGDCIVVVNAKKIHLSGKKLDGKSGKIYYHHTGYPGGIKSNTALGILSSKFPERLLEMSVKRMLPKTVLGRNQLKDLHIYSGPDHPHQAQVPKFYDFAAMNPKNSKNNNL
ncbi:50S ribosomal protein L13 [Rickettsia endosymbiont of Cardiosporidium cionae]|uniref:50S ribosomal protein L13 n=1 Tax=Rickettsia endosymbiont of Cardiosporidium cionae TaxID=2777155 RepID=UPI001893E545|nr:50S ribosomal protein L13 [Rickettsia endosymbiont of Cardiosporidium cionae]KAF8818216.1 50S ribosomal protein L13 [Rickettsia endosymbiont of Cardiosporidium cionae]